MFGMAIQGKHGMAGAGQWGMRLGEKKLPEGWVVAFSGGSAYFNFTREAGDVIYVDWGDGNTGTYTWGTGGSHTYADNEEYIVRIYGTALKVWFSASTASREPLLKRVLPCDPSKLLRDNNLADCFYYCISLTSLSSGLFSNTPELTDVSRCFYVCNSLTSLPSGLFSNTPELTNATQCFHDCASLTSLPSGLFSNAPALEFVSGCFRGCNEVSGSIPALWTNSNITSYSLCYYYTGHELTEPPNWTHSVTNICGAACAGWTGGQWAGEGYCNCS